MPVGYIIRFEVFSQWIYTKIPKPFTAVRVTAKYLQLLILRYFCFYPFLNIRYQRISSVAGICFKLVGRDIYLLFVDEHHVAVYAGKDNQTIVKAARPTDLLRNSIVTPSLGAGILNSKYINAVPLYRLEQEFARNDINISWQVMANWTIQCADRYFSLLYDRLHEELHRCHVSQADETPVLVSKDRRAAGSKSYMWVYRTGKMYYDPPIILYDYQKTRKADHPREFLEG